MAWGKENPHSLFRDCTAKNPQKAKNKSTIWPIPQHLVVWTGTTLPHPQPQPSHIFESLLIREWCFQAGNRRGSLVRVGGVLLEEVCLWGWALGLQMLKLSPVFLSLPAACGSRHRTLTFYSPKSFLCAPMLPTMLIINYTSEIVSNTQFNAFLLKSCCGHGVSSWQ